MKATFHQALLENITDELQVPEFFSMDEINRGKYILYFQGSRELALGLAGVQKKEVLPYPAGENVNKWLKRDLQYPLEAKRYGFGAIVFETGFEKPRREDRERITRYINRLVPGGIIILDRNQFEHKSRAESVKNMLTLVKAKVVPLTAMNPEADGSDPLMKLYNAIAEPLANKYIIGRKSI